MTLTEIRDEMVRIYICACFPRVTFNLTTGAMDIDYVWKSEETQQAYQTMLVEYQRLTLAAAGTERREEMRLCYYEQPL